MAVARVSGQFAAVVSRNDASPTGISLPSAPDDTTGTNVVVLVCGSRGGPHTFTAPAGFESAARAASATLTLEVFVKPITAADTGVYTVDIDQSDTGAFLLTVEEFTGADLTSPAGRSGVDATETNKSAVALSDSLTTQTAGEGIVGAILTRYNGATSVTWSGSGSPDPSGTAEATSGGTAELFVGAGSIPSTVQPSITGTLSVGLVCHGAMTTLRAATAPTVNAGANVTANEASAFTKTATNSGGSEDSWTVTLENAGGTGLTVGDFTVDTATAGQVTISKDPLPNVDADATLTFRVTATNGVGSDFDDFSLTIVDLNDPPTFNAGPNQTVQVGALVQMAGTGGDPDGTIAAYEWEAVTAGAPALSSGSVEDPTVDTTGAAEGDYTYRGRAQDTDGAWSAWDTVVITVVAAAAPTGAWTQTVTSTPAVAGVAAIKMRVRIVGLDAGDRAYVDGAKLAAAVSGVWSRGGIADTATATVETMLEDGTVETVRGGAALPLVDGAATVVVREHPAGAVRSYRTRMSAVVDNVPVASDPTEWQPVAASGVTSWWLRAPEQPGLDMPVMLAEDGFAPLERAVTEQVQVPIGATVPIVRQSVWQTPQGAVTLLVDGRTARERLAALMGWQGTLLLQAMQDRPGEPAEQWYVVPLSGWQTARTVNGPYPMRTVTIPFQVVDRP